MGNIYNMFKVEHDERVTKTPDRISYAMERLAENDITCEVKNEETGHIHAWRKSDDRLFQFWAGTGKIMNRKERGIDNLIDILNK